MSLRIAFALALALALVLATCSERTVRTVVQRSKIETSIASELATRFGSAVTTHCAFVAGMPFECKAVLADGSALPIAIKRQHGGWDWRIEGRVIETRPLLAHIKAMLTDLGLDQTVDCGAPIVRVSAGERIACAFSGGGAAFVEVSSTGDTVYELAIDRAAAQARGEPRVPDRERVLLQTSRALEHSGDDEADEIDEPAADGGLAKP